MIASSSPRRSCSANRLTVKFSCNVHRHLRRHPRATPVSAGAADRGRSCRSHRGRKGADQRIFAPWPAISSDPVGLVEHAFPPVAARLLPDRRSAGRSAPEVRSNKITSMLAVRLFSTQPTSVGWLTWHFSRCAAEVAFAGQHDDVTEFGERHWSVGGQRVAIFGCGLCGVRWAAGRVRRWGGTLGHRLTVPGR